MLFPPTKWIVMWGVAEITLVHEGSAREENVKVMEWFKLLRVWKVYFKGDSCQKVHKAKMLIVKETVAADHG